MKTVNTNSTQNSAGAAAPGRPKQGPTPRPSRGPFVALGGRLLYSANGVYQ